MSHVESFDSMEAMYDHIAKSEAAAWERTNDAQKALLTKDHFFWVRPYTEMDIFIFGEFHASKWLEDEKRLCGTDEEGLSEWLYSEKSFHSRRARGYLTGRAYSPLEPSGELGDTHVSQVYEISKTAFDEAHRANWVVDGTTRTFCPALYAELKAYAEAEAKEMNA